LADNTRDAIFTGKFSILIFYLSILFVNSFRQNIFWIKFHYLILTTHPTNILSFHYRDKLLILFRSSSLWVSYKSYDTENCRDFCSVQC